jgi:hypothetical protein
MKINASHAISVNANATLSVLTHPWLVVRGQSHNSFANTNTNRIAADFQPLFSANWSVIIDHLFFSINKSAD